MCVNTLSCNSNHRHLCTRMPALNASQCILFLRHANTPVAVMVVHGPWPCPADTPANTWNTIQLHVHIVPHSCWKLAPHTHTPILPVQASIGFLNRSLQCSVLVVHI